MENTRKWTKVKDLAKKSSQELEARLIEINEELFKRRLYKNVSEEKDSAFFWRSRKEIARIKTCMTKQLKASVEQVKG